MRWRMTIDPVCRVAARLCRSGIRCGNDESRLGHNRANRKQVEKDGIGRRKVLNHVEHDDQIEAMRQQISNRFDDLSPPPKTGLRDQASVVGQFYAKTLPAAIRGDCQMRTVPAADIQH